MCEIETGGAPFLTNKSILPLFLGKKGIYFFSRMNIVYDMSVAYTNKNLRS